MTKSDERYADAQVSATALVLGLFIVLGIAIAVGAIYGDVARTLLLLFGFLALGILAYRTRLVVTVSSQGVRVGPAAVAWEWIDRVEVLDGPAMRDAVGPGSHPTDFLRIRSTTAGLRVWLADPSDPHRCWVTSIRHPERLRVVLATLPVRWTA